jgi:hypothetical protein
MKDSLRFEAAMLALILVAALAGAAFEKSAAHRGSASSEQASQSQPARLASGS